MAKCFSLSFELDIVKQDSDKYFHLGNIPAET